VIEHKQTAAVNLISKMSLDLSVRIIAFAVSSDGLDVALLPAPETTSDVMIPAGTLRTGEMLSDAAVRIASDALSAQPDYLEQLYTFSIADDAIQVVVAYFALLSAETRRSIERSAKVTFIHVDAQHGLSDIDQGILDYAKVRLRAKLGYSNIGFFLLPREFTLSELQDVYESVIGRTLDKRNFRRRILASRILEPVGAKRPTNHRPAALYRFTGKDPSTGALTPAETDWSS
jgi:8-oxo-dGTP diphosphatase